MLAAPYPHCCLLKRAPIWSIAWDVPQALVEERCGIRICLRLDILGEGQRDSTGFRRACQHTHSLGESGQHLLRTRNAIPVTTHRLEATVHRDILAVFGFYRLSDGTVITEGRKYS